MPRHKYVWDKYKMVESDERIRALNTAIHELIVMKRHRIEERKPTKEILAVQHEINRLLVMKKNIEKATKFLAWRERQENPRRYRKRKCT